jgi:hypothetical protein
MLSTATPYLLGAAAPRAARPARRAAAASAAAGDAAPAPAPLARRRLLAGAAALGAGAALWTPVPASAAAAVAGSVYTAAASGGLTLEGAPFSLEALAGKATIFVNVASA